MQIIQFYEDYKREKKLFHFHLFFFYFEAFLKFLFTHYYLRL